MNVFNERSVSAEHVERAPSKCDVCGEQLDKDDIFKDLSGLRELFGTSCFTCDALAEIGGLMFQDLECQESTPLDYYKEAI